MIPPVRRFLSPCVVALSLSLCGTAAADESVVSSLVSGTTIAGAVDTSVQCDNFNFWIKIIIS